MKPCCTECVPEVLAKKQRDVARVASWRKGKDDIREYRNAEARKYLDKYRDKVNEYRRSWYDKNKEKVRAACNRYNQEHPEKNCAAAARRRKSLKERIVPWSDLDAIEQFYKNRPEGKVVDHIIPLKGKNVSGLHVIENLQYLTFEENAKKGIRVELS